jgi:hypothetical protein
MQVAGIGAITGSQDGVGEVVAEYQRRREPMVEDMNALPGMFINARRARFFDFLILLLREYRLLITTISCSMKLGWR